ncbi:MAG: adenylate/guanylate cyclase domain-containing protein [Cyclobacteriaceae bacterium]|nr:adenylate/guanylate cyclase domain-containing protein [Cyclobacteriaceae bacterium]MDH5251326.1 adenylate/guanylate cyclase domain-containing protein [Cyclobacteriaceae bacterium]
MPQSRQLAAIMFTDIVGYTALMGSDDKKAFSFLKKNREIQKPVIEECNGRWIKEMGDGVMASFSLVSDAVHAAIKIMVACNAANEYQLCIGIHLAEVVFENDDVFGDGVNIAARIQSAAGPGCIFISETVHHNIANKSEIKSQFVKEEKLKNVSQPVRMYQVLFADSEILVPEKAAPAVIENRIAVLPFVNMSSDPEQEFFSDGISEEIINMLAQVSDLKVIARTSCFAFKGKNLDVKFIGEQLKVSHVLEGSVRKSGNKLRITAQLIKVSDGFHLYSEKFDRMLEDIFDVQDEISLAILDAIKSKILPTEKEAVLKKYTDNLEAYDAYLKGRFHVNNFSLDELLKAIGYFDAAIAIDPNYAIAHASRAFSYMVIHDFKWLPSEKSKPQVLESAFKSLELDDQIAESHIAVGRIKLHWEWKIKEALELFRKAIKINPNSAECHVQIGLCLALLGHDKEAMDHSDKALNIDPFSIMNIWFASPVSFYAGDFEKVLANSKRMISMAPNFFSGYMIAGLGYMGLKRYDEAIEAFETMLKLAPGTYTYGILGTAYGMNGEKSKARDVIEKMKGFDGVGLAGNHSIGDVYASFGEWDNAFHYYKRSVDIREGAFMLWVKRLNQLWYPEMVNDPRAIALYKRIGLPD